MSWVCLAEIRGLKVIENNLEISMKTIWKNQAADSDQSTSENCRLQRRGTYCNSSYMLQNNRNQAGLNLYIPGIGDNQVEDPIRHYTSIEDVPIHLFFSSPRWTKDEFLAERDRRRRKRREGEEMVLAKYSDKWNRRTQEQIDESSASFVDEKVT